MVEPETAKSDVEAPATAGDGAGGQQQQLGAPPPPPSGAAKCDGEKRLPKWVSAVVAVVVLLVTLSAIIPVIVVGSRKSSSADDASEFEARTGELSAFLAEPLKGAEWLTASFTPAPAAAADAAARDGSGDPPSGPPPRATSQGARPLCATSAAESRRHNVPMCRTIIGVYDRLCPEGYFKDFNGDCVLGVSFTSSGRRRRR